MNDRELMRQALAALINRARELYADKSDDNIEIDSNAQLSETDNGTWVQAWVWVPKDDE